jgi:hypothetical protein
VITRTDRYRLSHRFDLDFNLPGNWYFRLGLFDSYDSQPPEGFSSNDYGWSNAFGFSSEAGGGRSKASHPG